MPKVVQQQHFLGTATHILVYHVHDNKDIFYTECQDGVKAITVGYFRDRKAPIIFVGGNSSVHGYDHTGNEVFWTAVGDAVTSMILLDYNKDGLKEVEINLNNLKLELRKEHNSLNINIRLSLELNIVYRIFLNITIFVQS